ATRPSRPRPARCWRTPLAVSPRWPASSSVPSSPRLLRASRICRRLAGRVASVGACSTTGVMLRKDEVEVAELVPAAAGVEGGVVRALEQLPPGHRLDEGQV